MAARENQGLQIALIIFVVLTIILTVTTYMFFSNYQQERAAAAALRTENDTAKRTAQQATQESEAFKAMIGAAATDKLEAVQEAHKKEVDTYAQGMPEASQTYQALIKHLGTELNNANTRIAEITANEKALTEKIQADEAAKLAEIAKYTEKLTATASELEGEREKFSTQWKKVNAEKDSLTQKFESTRKSHEDLSKKSSEQISTLSTENTKLSGLLQNINNEKLRGQKANEYPDGKITWVNQKSRTVWINLGAADGLRRQTMFRVVNSDATNPAEAGIKGRVEVVRLLQPHLSEARIVEDLISDPLMPGDLVASPTWAAGTSEHFALAGVFDIDKDGEDDFARIRDLISLNGGVIDAEVTADGSREGEMTINTKYLVIGDEPKAEGKNLDAWSKINEEAQTLGIRTIGIKEFLNYLGFKPEERTVALGRDARPADFKPRSPGVQRQMPTTTRPKIRREISPDPE